MVNLIIQKVLLQILLISNLWDANNGQGHGYTGTFVKTVYDPSPVGFRVPRLAEFEKINNGNNGKAAFTPLTGVLSYFGLQYS